LRYSSTRTISTKNPSFITRYHRIQSLSQQSSGRHEESIRADKSNLKVT